MLLIWVIRLAVGLVLAVLIWAQNCTYVKFSFLCNPSYFAAFLGSAVCICTSVIPGCMQLLSRYAVARVDYCLSHVNIWLPWWTSAHLRLLLFICGLSVKCLTLCCTILTLPVLSPHPGRQSKFIASQSENCTYYWGAVHTEFFPLFTVSVTEPRGTHRGE